ncbi:hypothetical protein [Burkholderia ubonensis]|uniref:hypothetical protein n=1 Tax=Burkholderia ubonensis TaxID=101571 RepID=UPI0012F930B6|nr:hypothetical protein [Burkholderia ubonensis]
MLADTGRPWQAPAAAKAMAAAGKRGGGPVAPMRRSAEARRSVNTLPRHSHPRPGLAIESRHARIATSGQPRCADKRIPLHDERHSRCVAAFRARLPMPQAISGRHSHAHSRAAARNSVVKMSAPRRRERNIPERLSSEISALPSDMPRRSRVPARIRAASAIQRDETFARRRFTRSPPEIRKKTRVVHDAHSRIHSTARPRNAIGFHPRKTRVQAVNPTHPAISCAQQ